MNSKILGNKLGFKSGVSKTDTDMEKLMKENAALKKTMEEMSKLKGKISDTERNRLLEKILELETQKERNDQENSSKNEEIAKLKEALRSKNNTNGFSAALEEKAKAAEMIAEDLRNQITTLTARCVALESGVTVQQNSQEETQKHHKKLLLNAQKDLEVEKITTAQLNEDLSTLRQLYEREKKEVKFLSKSLQSLQDSDRQQRGDEKKRWHDKIQRLKSEFDSTRIQLDEEKKKSADLSNQIQMLQRSAQKQQEEQTRIAALEQQIHRCTSDFENEKSDRQKIQHQLYKVLKELRMAREEITRLKPKQHLSEFSYTELSSNLQRAFEDQLSMREQLPSPRRSSHLDESFLECPKCSAVYPTSQHRELLAHLDYCTS
ncbi:centrosomal protein of 55 kDa [Bombina bombina]|uniref:centrosomal protein of 55 kDa n=1 Tax=Bombina bombina TaxID=8345 RepID=UPI00235ABDBF|nr:centrosomal protein of 55 kDa [Bombina bombina]